MLNPKVRRSTPLKNTPRTSARFRPKVRYSGAVCRSETCSILRGETHEEFWRAGAYDDSDESYQEPDQITQIYDMVQKRIGGGIRRIG